MRELKNLNTLAILLPTLILITYPIFKEGSLALAAISLIITGFIQVLTGIYFWSINPKNIHIKLYFFLVIIFFCLIIYKGNDNWFWIMPPFLCLYFSIIIYTQKETK